MRSTLTTNLFCRRLDTPTRESIIMDKVTKKQFSIAFFVTGLVMLFIPDLKHLDAIPLGISQYFGIMFYLGLIFIITGYYLK